MTQRGGKLTLLVLYSSTITRLQCNHSSSISASWSRLLDGCMVAAPHLAPRQILGLMHIAGSESLGDGVEKSCR